MKSAPRLALWALFIAGHPGSLPSVQLGLDGLALKSLVKMFGESIAMSTSTIRLSAQEIDSIAVRSKTRWPGDSVRIYTVRGPGQIVVGYGFPDEVKGKTQLITYLVGVGPDGCVKDVDVLVYRESYGGEITYETFRKQFRQKSSSDNLRAGKNIKNISGATISVRAITDGVRRILATFEAIRPRLVK
jgi:hypothetical protein